MAEENVSIPPEMSFSDVVKRDSKNILVGLAALPAHIITNPMDIAGKALVVGLSAVPVLGSFIAASYAFKQSLRETDDLKMSILKGAGAFLLSSIPGAGPVITGMYAVKNIGAQVEKEAASTGQSTLSALASKYSKAKENLVELKEGGIKQNLQKVVANVKTLGTVQGWKDIASSLLKTFGPLTERPSVETNVQSAPPSEKPIAGGTADGKPIPFAIPIAIVVGKKVDVPSAQIVTRQGIQSAPPPSNPQSYSPSDTPVNKTSPQGQVR